MTKLTRIFHSSSPETRTAPPCMPEDRGIESGSSERAMPKPNCTEKMDVGAIEFDRLGCLDGGSMSSDGGMMLLGQLDRKLGLMDATARCIADLRNRQLTRPAASR